MLKNNKHILITSLIIISIILLLNYIAGCGGDNSTAINPHVSNPSEDTGSAVITINWPQDGKAITSSVIQPDVNVVEVSITGTGLASPMVENIQKGVSSKTITGIPIGSKQFEFKGKNIAGTVLSHRIKPVTILKGQTVPVQAHLGVSILNTGFYPQTFTLSVGETLYWNNNDTIAHTVTSNDGTSFNSNTYFPGGVPAGGEYYHTFTTTSSGIAYHCGNVTTMTGIVVVDGSSAWSSNIRVDDGSITAPHSYALRPGIAVDSYGNAYAVWEDGRDDINKDIYFSYCSSGGNWSTNIRVDDASPGLGAGSPSIAVDPSGNAYVVWVDTRNDTYGGDIYFSYRDHTTGLWSANTRVDDAPTGSRVESPSIAVDPSGNAYAVWADQRNDSGDIYFSYRDHTTGLWSANTRVDDGLLNITAQYPDITVDPSGNAYAVWQDLRESNAHIYFSYRLAGGSWGVNTKVDNEAEFTWSGYPSIAVDPSGNVYAIWQGSKSEHTIYSSYRQTGGNWGTSERVDDTPSPMSRQNWTPDIAVDPSGNAYAVWVDMRDSTWISAYYYIYFSYRQSGGNWGTNIKLNNDNYSWHPHIAVTSDGKVYTIWDDRSLGLEHVFSSIRQ